MKHPRRPASSSHVHRAGTGRFPACSWTSILILFFSCVSFPAQGGDGVQVEETRLSVLGDLLGQETLASDGTTLLVALDGGGGGAYRKVGDFWQQEQLLDVEPADLSDRGIPTSGDVSDDVPALGFPDEGAGGEVYVFTRGANGWQQQQILSSSAATPARFGASVVVDGDLIVIGDPDAADDGEVYVFERSGQTWTQIQALAPPDSRARDFGSSLALSGDLLVTGDPGYTADNLAEIGSLFIYRRLGGSFGFEERVFASTERLGADVAVDTVPGNSAFGAGIETIAAIGDSSLVRVYEFDGGNWSLVDSPSTSFGKNLRSSSSNEPTARSPVLALQKRKS